MPRPLDTCPHCQALWDMEEIEDQRCGACGWPDVEIDDEDDLPDDEPWLDWPAEDDF